jgi:arginine:pyruvate transaminase
VLTAEEVASIGAVCQKHDLWIVADEVYEELVFDGDFASPFDNPDLADRVIAVSVHLQIPCRAGIPQRLGSGSA